MKKFTAKPVFCAASFCFGFILFGFFKIAAQTISPQQLYGTWKATYQTSFGNFGASNHEFLFTLYSDQRIYSVQTYGLLYNGNWKVEDDLFLCYWDHETGPVKTQTTYFNGKTWRYTGLGDNIVYTAVKISETPVPIPRTDVLGKNQNPARPGSTIINLAQLYGAWKASNDKKETVEFNIYPDQRLYAVYGETAWNASWTIAGDKFYDYYDYIDEPSVLKTTAFNGTIWQYYSVGDGTKYTATKVSNIPQKLTPKQSTAPKQAKPGAQPAADKGRYSDSGSTCFCCAGTHKKNCSSCNGQGGHYDRVSYQQYNASTGYYDTYYRDEWRTCTAWGCDNGKTDCDCCDKRTDKFFNPHSTDEVPHDQTMIGNWNGNGGDVWTFFEAGTYNSRMFQIISGGQKITGEWVIEDGLMKLKYSYSTDWQHYAFNAGWTAANIVLTDQESYRQIGLTKRK